MVQPVGGISEKITGFFDTCSLLGLTGTQGAMIPLSNKTNLFLPERVVQAIAEGRFRIWAVGHIDDGIALLSGMNTAEVAERVSAALRDFAEKVKAFRK